MIPQWSLQASYSFQDEHILVFYDDIIKCRMETLARKAGEFDEDWGEQKVLYAMDGDSRVFKTEEALIAALQKKHRHKTYFLERVK